MTLGETLTVQQLTALKFRPLVTWTSLIISIPQAALGPTTPPNATQLTVAAKSGATPIGIVTPTDASFAASALNVSVRGSGISRIIANDDLIAGIGNSNCDRGTRSASTALQTHVLQVRSALGPGPYQASELTLLPERRTTKRIEPLRTAAFLAWLAWGQIQHDVWLTAATSPISRLTSPPDRVASVAIFPNTIKDEQQVGHEGFRSVLSRDGARPE